MERSRPRALAWLAIAAGLALSGLAATGCGATAPAEPSETVRVAPAAAAAAHAVRIHLPPDTGKARTAPELPGGGPSAIPCARCHEKLKAPAIAPAADKIKTVHREMAFTHGSLSCYSCHDPKDGYRALRLADGTAVAYENVMTLCSQCHGPQRTDYDHGAHGGMTGYWDLSRGPRERNACTVCHDPHAPEFPSMRPTFKPKDRFLTRVGAEAEHDDVH